jgi:uncharacterized RDD family membrane protein YckC
MLSSTMSMDSASVLPRRVSTDLVIETPENVILTYRLAGPATRLFAYVVDFLVRMVLIYLGYVAAVLGGAAGSMGVSIGLLLVIFFLVDWGYYGVCEGLFRGKTLGKHMFGLRVIQEQGYPVTLWGALLRNVVRAADSLPSIVIPFYGIGFCTMLTAGRFRRLGDLVARTVVIEERRVRVPREPVILEKIEPLSRTELGGFVPAGQTLALIEEFLGRRHVLTYRRGHAMAFVLAKVLAERLSFSGDPQLVQRYPMAFLARVFATFHQTVEDEELEREHASGARREPAQLAAAGGGR